MTQSERACLGGNRENHPAGNRSAQKTAGLDRADGVLYLELLDGVVQGKQIPVGGLMGHLELTQVEALSLPSPLQSLLVARLVGE